MLSMHAGGARRRSGGADARHSLGCPHCRTRQPWKWEQVEWSKDARDESGEWDFQRVRETTSMRCASCNHYFEDTDRTRRELNATGRYVVTNPNAPRENAGFHWNALCAMSWGRLAELYLRAKAAARRGDVSLIQQFYQKRLALAWREYLEDYKLEIVPGGYLKGETWDGEAGVDASGRIVPAGEPCVCPLRILTVDCQLDHLWLVVRAWAGDGSSRLVWNERVLTFTDVEAVQERFGIHPNLVFVDAGLMGFVFAHCAPWPAVVRASFDGQAFREAALVFCGALTPADFQTAFRRLEEQSRELEAAQVEPASGMPGKKPRPAPSPDS